MVTSSTLIGIVEDVREDVLDNGESYGQCFPVSKGAMNEISNQTEIDADEMKIEEVRMGRYQTIRHYVVSVPLKYIEDASGFGRGLLDGTLDQYCDEYESKGYVDISLGPKTELAPAYFFESKGEAAYSG